ncbi:MAG: hypothetical protein JO023_04130 [Chloroflexi bacterium]|nr:hypothetical protein [Chloroflexota bacterium]
MVTTVNNAVAELAALGPRPLLSGMVVVALLVLVVAYELASTSGPRFRPLARHLPVVIAPLALVFAAIVLSRLLAHG